MNGRMRANEAGAVCSDFRWEFHYRIDELSLPSAGRTAHCVDCHSIQLTSVYKRLRKNVVMKSTFLRGAETCSKALRESARVLKRAIQQQIETRAQRKW